MKENSLASLVAKELTTYKRDKNGNLRDAKGHFAKLSDAQKVHHDVCHKLFTLASDSGFPMGVLVYIAIGTSAHKPSVFAKGYTSIDVDKAKRIIEMCNYFAKHFGKDSWKSNDKLVHAMYRYDNMFEDGEDKMNFVKACIDDLPTEGVKLSQFSTMKEFSKFLFGDNLKYNERGYFCDGVDVETEVAVSK